MILFSSSGGPAPWRPDPHADVSATQLIGMLLDDIYPATFGFAHGNGPRALGSNAIARSAPERSSETSLIDA